MQRTSTESAMRNRVRHAQSQSRVRVLYQIEDDIWIHSRVLEVSDGSHSICSDDQSAEVEGSTSSTEHRQLSLLWLVKGLCTDISKSLGTLTKHMSLDHQCPLSSGPIVASIGRLLQLGLSSVFG